MLSLTKERFSFALISTLKSLSTLPTTTCFLRHDVDLSPEKALEMAEIEASQGIYSTYYVLLRSPFYNALTKKNIEIWKTILNLGHEIGLHFDPNAYDMLDKRTDAWLEKLKQEVEIFEKELFCSVQSFSFHNPNAGTWDTLKSNEYINLINASCSLIQQASFYSDSRGELKKGPYESFLQSIPEQGSIYVLIHPDWWFDVDLSMEDKIIQAANLQSENALQYWEKIVYEDGGTINLRQRHIKQ
jgi:hypothetical protein